MYIQGEELARLAYNSMQFVNPKSIRLPDMVLLVVSHDTLRVYACDDYVGITDFASTSEITNENYQFAISGSSVKEVEKFARTNKKYRIQITVSDTEAHFSLDTSEEYPEEVISAERKAEIDANWDILDRLLFEEASRTDPGDYYLRKERVSNLSKLKAPNESPIGFRHVNLAGYHIVRFRLGTTLQGVVKPVDVDKVKPEFLWEENA